MHRKLESNGENPVVKKPHPLDDSDADLDAILSQYATPAPPTHKEEYLSPLAPGVLEGCGFLYVSRQFSEEDRKIAVQVVRENGGTISSPQAAGFLLAPLEGAWLKGEGEESDLEGMEGAVVTMIWLVS